MGAEDGFHGASIFVGGSGAAILVGAAGRGNGPPSHCRIPKYSMSFRGLSGHGGGAGDGADSMQGGGLADGRCRDARSRLRCCQRRHPQARRPRGESQPTLLGTYGDWGAYTANPGGKKVCFALAKPKTSKTDPAGRKRDPAYIFISTRPAENVKNEISVIIGYPFKPSSDATAEIGTTKFAMYTQNDGAWIKNVAEEARMIDAMRKGSDLTVKGMSGRGTPPPTSSRSRASPRRSTAPSRNANRRASDFRIQEATRRPQRWNCLDDPCRHRRLGVRALARRILSEGPAAGARARACEPQRHQHRDQRHVLPHAEARKLPQMGGRDAGRFRVLAQGSAVRHQSPRAGGSGSVDRAVLRQRRAGAEIEARSDLLADGADQEIRPGGFRGVPRAAAAGGRRQGDPPCGRGAARELRVAGIISRCCASISVAPVLVESDKHPPIADVTSDFVYARLQRTAEDVPTGYSPKALATWAKHAQTLADGGTPADLPTITPPAKSKAKRDVFIYMISGAKVRAPAAAMALIAEAGEIARIELSVMWDGRPGSRCGSFGRTNASADPAQTLSLTLWNKSRTLDGLIPGRGAMDPDKRSAWLRKLDEECPYQVVLPRRQLADDSEIMNFLTIVCRQVRYVCRRRICGVRALLLRGPARCGDLPVPLRAKK